MNNDDPQTIECRVGSWYFKRMLMMAAMLGIFAAWFLYDGKIGYAKKNRAALAEEAFTAASAGSTWEAYAAAGPAYRDMRPEGELAEFAKSAYAAGSETMPWSDYAKKNDLPEDPAPGSPEARVEEAFADGKLPGSQWEDFARSAQVPVDPSEAQDIALKRAFESAGQKREFAGYAASLGFDSKGNKYHTRKDIMEQLVIAGTCAAGAAVALLFLFLSRNRVLRADRQGITFPNGQRVAFESVYRVDPRKWKHKGLAYLYYKEGDAGKKAVLDDLKYVGAQKILDRLLSDYEGEVVVSAEDAAEDGGDDGSEGAAPL